MSSPHHQHDDRADSQRQDPGRRRPGHGVAAGLAALLVVALPAVGTAYLAAISLSGCLVECTSPTPARGVAWAAVTVALLAVPVLVALSSARVPLRRAPLWLLGVPLAVAVGAALVHSLR